MSNDKQLKVGLVRCEVCGYPYVYCFAKGEKGYPNIVGYGDVEGRLGMLVSGNKLEKPIQCEVMFIQERE